MRGYLCEICKREVGNLRNVRQGMWDAPIRTHRVYRVIVPVSEGTSNKMAGRHGAPRPPMTDVGTETAFRLEKAQAFPKK